MVGGRQSQCSILRCGRGFVLCVILASLASCVHAGPDRDANAALIARSGGFEPVVSQGVSRDLQLYRRDNARSGPLFVYIEGDGAAYLDQRTPSSDPTPIDPLALRLAAADPGAAILYVARPCQFAPGRGDRRCTVLDWTTHRFSRDNVGAVSEAIDRERARKPERPLVLVGYSGGGVVAALVAARRSDVALLITLGAPLDTADWTRRMWLSPLDGSDSPLDHAAALAHVPQVDFVGEKDAIVPIETVRSFVDALGPTAAAKVVVVPDYDHRCCWLRDWPQLRETALRSALAATSDPQRP